MVPRFLFLLAAFCFGVTTAISEDKFVNLISGLFAHLPPIILPDMSLSKLNLFANATNITMSGLTLTDFQMFIQNPEHLVIDLDGVGAKLSLTLDAGITGPIPVHHKTTSTGTLANTSLANTFLVKDGNAAISKLDIDIGQLKLDFHGNDPIDQFLANTFLPFLKSEMQKLLPPVLIVVFKMLDFQHLMDFMLFALPSLPLPTLSLAFEGYELAITDVKLADVAATSKSFFITKNELLNFDIAGVSGGGSITFTVGKAGEKKQTGVGKLQFSETEATIAGSVVKSKHNGYKLKYSHATNEIGQFSMVCSTCTDPLVVWLLTSLEPMVKSLLEDLIPFLVKSFMDLP